MLKQGESYILVILLYVIFILSFNPSLLSKKLHMTFWAERLNCLGNSRRSHTPHWHLQFVDVITENLLWAFLLKCNIATLYHKCVWYGRCSIDKPNPWWSLLLVQSSFTGLFFCSVYLFLCQSSPPDNYPTKLLNYKFSHKNLSIVTYNQTFLNGCVEILMFLCRWHHIWISHLFISATDG